MEVKWTDDQQKVISLRDRNILVSAAAGSGKTAVLVQRILEMLTDPLRSVNIDELLIMTFTRAAAGEMKERISRALEKAVSEDPDNEVLQRQLTGIHTAQITTIDGFCGYVIRNYFHMIDLDPGYRVGDEGEMKLLSQDVLEELLESCYEEKTPEFLYFVECFAPDKSDRYLKDYILQVYNAAMSNPFPQEWLDHCLDYHNIEPGGMNDMVWMEEIWRKAHSMIEEAKGLITTAREICQSMGGPYYYDSVLICDEADVNKISDIIENRDYNQLADFLSKLKHGRMNAKKDPDVDDGLKELVQNLRIEYKELIKAIRVNYFMEQEEELVSDIELSRRQLSVLVELTRKFIDAFARKKREKNIIDFNDMEHFALQILLEKKEGEWVRTPAAMELSARYKEVMVDEYQDSNLVQEYLTAAVSGNGKDLNNTFMVGDVKQSIYRFRQARPDLFMEKYDTYTMEDSGSQRIDLHTNFRSRSEVLHSVNYIFRQIMGKNLGGVQYDEAASLHPGAKYPEGQRDGFTTTEVILIEKDSEEMEDQKSLQNAIEMEALAIAQRIHDLVGKELVYDRDLNQYRSVEFRDIVVLLRTADKWADSFARVFASKGISSYSASKSGYFSALEVVTVLNYLRICDNPYQDIPLLGVLRSPIVGVTSEELAQIRVAHNKMSLYESICLYLEEAEEKIMLNNEDISEGTTFEATSDEADGKILELKLSGGISGDIDRCSLKVKLQMFMKLFKEIRQMSSYTPVNQLLRTVMERTGYGNYVKAMPAGEQRKANLDMLIEKALDYEKTSYRGLFNFVRYVEQLQKYEVDYGEVNLASSESGAVQIMTIHKSKGLEFPIVFVAGMGKGMNLMDTRARILIHPKYGISSDVIFPEKRMMIPTLIKRMMQRVLLDDTLGEELRILYVALTRAKEKLIITGTGGNIPKTIGYLQRMRTRTEELLPLSVRDSAKTYWDYILPALSGHDSMDELFQSFGIYEPSNPVLQDELANYVISLLTPKDLVLEEIEVSVDQVLRHDLLVNWDSTTVYDEMLRDQIKERFEYVYPYEELRVIPSKASISDLKKSRFENFEEDEFEYDNPYLSLAHSEEDIVPKFIAGETAEVRGAARGTAYHRVLECLNYRNIDTDEMLEEQICEMVHQNKMSQEEADVVEIADIRRFLNSNIGLRMRKAALEGLLKREQPFVFSVPASRLNHKWDSDTSVLIQGIVDAYFIEEGKIIIVDYKTDHIFSKEKLYELYHKQLEGYADALAQLTHLPVAECVIYSFTIHDELIL